MKTLTKISILTILAAACFLQLSAQTVVFETSDDTQISKGSPNHNSGASTAMVVRNTYGSGGSTHWQADALVNFDISSIPVNAEIISATLYLYYYHYWDNNPAGRPLNCYRIAQPWNEMTVTWNNQPSCCSQPTASTLVPSTVGQWMSWDVAADVQQIVNDPNVVNHGWKITDEQYWGWANIPLIYFYTKENHDLIPYLEVEIIPAVQPGWEVIGGTQYSMTLLASITVDDVPFVAEGNNMAGVFGPGGENDCRAIGFGQNGLWNFTIVSNEVQGDELISIKIFEGIGSMIYDCNETIVFEDNAIIGTPDDPFLLSVTNPHILEISLNANWNWISFNVHPEDISVGNIFGILSDDIHQVKNQYKSATWHGIEHGWFGDLMNISEGEGYLVKMHNPVANFVITGSVIDPATPIQLSDGWNWIGYYPQQPLLVKDAMASIQANAIQVKSQSQSASWFESTGWIGDLAMMEPGLAYKLNMLNQDVLIYPDLKANKQNTVSNLKQTKGLQIAGGTSMNMVVIAEIYSTTDPDVVAVFDSKNQCVAIASPFEYESSQLWYLTVVGNVPDELLTFRLLDKDLQNPITCIETLQFADNATLGLPTHPFRLTALTEGSDSRSTFEGFELGQNYPNPFSKITRIEYMLPEPAKVKLLLINIAGLEIIEIINGKQAAGQHSAVIEKGLLNPGIYFYRLEAETANGVNRKTRKLIIH